MFNAEFGSWDILEPALERYEANFNQPFPVYEYIEVTRNDKYDFSIVGCKKLTELIDEKIKNNEAVAIPDGYIERLY